MTPFVWILVAAALGYGVLRFLKHRDKRETEKQDRADKRAKIARDDAQAMQRTLNGRR